MATARENKRVWRAFDLPDQDSKSLSRWLSGAASVQLFAGVAWIAVFASRDWANLANRLERMSDAAVTHYAVIVALMLATATALALYGAAYLGRGCLMGSLMAQLALMHAMTVEFDEPSVRPMGAFLNLLSIAVAWLALRLAEKVQEELFSGVGRVVAAAVAASHARHRQGAASAVGGHEAAGPGITAASGPIATATATDATFGGRGSGGGGSGGQLLASHGARQVIEATLESAAAREGRGAARGGTLAVDPHAERTTRMTLLLVKLLTIAEVLVGVATAVSAAGDALIVARGVVTTAAGLLAACTLVRDSRLWLLAAFVVQLATLSAYATTLWSVVQVRQTQVAVCDALPPEVSLGPAATEAQRAGARARADECSWLLTQSASVLWFSYLGVLSTGLAAWACLWRSEQVQTHGGEGGGGWEGAEGAGAGAAGLAASARAAAVARARRQRGQRRRYKRGAGRRMSAGFADNVFGMGGYKAARAKDHADSAGGRGGGAAGGGDGSWGDTHDDDVDEEVECCGKWYSSSVALYRKFTIGLMPLQVMVGVLLMLIAFETPPGQGALAGLRASHLIVATVSYTSVLVEVYATWARDRGYFMVAFILLVSTLSLALFSMHLTGGVLHADASLGPAAPTNATAVAAAAAAASASGGRGLGSSGSGSGSDDGRGSTFGGTESAAGDLASLRATRFDASFLAAHRLTVAERRLLGLSTAAMAFVALFSLAAAYTMVAFSEAVQDQWNSRFWASLIHSVEQSQCDARGQRGRSWSGDADEEHKPNSARSQTGGTG